jgi:C1A family cysteine protease
MKLPQSKPGQLKQPLSAPLAKRGFNAMLSATLAFSLSGVSAGAAFGAEDSVDSNAANQTQSAVNAQTYAYATSADTTLAANDGSDYKPSAKFDLRDPDGDGDTSDSVVTPVKLQNPWGSCWGFSIIAAAETSILSDLGKTYDETKLDLSELQLAKTIFSNNGVPEQYVTAGQGGEGYHNSSSNPNAGLDSNSGAMTGGGFPAYGASVFSAGIGPVDESAAPYKNADNLMYCRVWLKDATDKDFKVYQLTEQQAKQYETDGATVSRICWTGNYEASNGTSYYTDWEIDESLWGESLYELENGNIMPETRILDDDGNYKGTDMRAVNAIKKEMEVYGRAVSTCFCADTSKPNENGVAKYMNQNNWSHYTYETVEANHAVTIVGWDDTYSRTNFGDGQNNLPEGDGAWLVKNSWGAESNEFPHKTGWGNDGYFWISYYDRSITESETFDFDVDSSDDSGDSYINQYDYLPEMTSIANSSESPISSANIFTAEGDLAVRNLSAATYKPNTTVNYKVYLLDDEAANPTDADHSTLVYETDETYDYGGFHRTALDESDWIAMRKGQRYAVVTTQKCNDDGYYYQGVAVNISRPTDAMIAKTTERTYASVQETTYTDLVETYKSYCRAKYPTMSEQEIETEAIALTDARFEDDDIQVEIENRVSDLVDAYKNSYYVSKVNEGESWTNAVWNVDASTMTATSESTTEWTDWKDAVTDAVESKHYYSDQLELVADNAPIKTYSEVRSWAGVDELSELEQAIADAKETLAAAAISVDGTDVAESQLWMTQEQYDALSAAVADAEAQLALAGSDYKTTLANTTPTSDKVTSATASLDLSAQKGSLKATNGEQPADSKAAADKAASSTGAAKTGDVVTIAVAVAAACMAAAAAVAAVARRRRVR